MDFEKLVIAVGALPLFDKWAWGTVLAAIFAAIGLVLFWERRHFRQRGLAGSWLALRLLALLLMLPLTVGVILVPATTISGPEALAYFYLALFSVGPLVWFGGHILCGRLLRPAFTKGQSLFLAFSGSLILFFPAIAISVAQGPIFHASRGIEESAFRMAEQTPLAHRVENLQRFTLPGVGDLHTQSLIAPPGIHVERIDRKIGVGWYDTKGSTRDVFCRDGESLHLMWSAREPAPALRLYWRNPAGKRMQADFAAGLPAEPVGQTRQFEIAFRSDGFDPPVPIPRSRASVAYLLAGEKLFFDLLSPLQPGETFDNDCIMRGYRRVASEREGPPQVVALMFHLPGGGVPLRAEIRRPESPVAQ